MVLVCRIGEQKIDTDRLVEKMKAVLDTTDDTIVRIWESTDEFDERWLDIIESKFRQ